MKRRKQRNKQQKIENYLRDLLAAISGAVSAEHERIKIVSQQTRMAIRKHGTNAHGVQRVGSLPRGQGNLGFELAHAIPSASPQPAVGLGRTIDGLNHGDRLAEAIGDVPFRNGAFLLFSADDHRAAAISLHRAKPARESRQRRPIDSAVIHFSSMAPSGARTKIDAQFGLTGSLVAGWVVPSFAEVEPLIERLLFKIRQEMRGPRMLCSGNHVAAQRERAVRVVITLQSDAHVVDIVQTAIPPRRFPRRLNRGQQERDHDPDKRNDDQQLNERERSRVFRF